MKGGLVMPTRSITLPSGGSTATSARRSSGRELPMSLPYAPVSSLLSQISLTCRAHLSLFRDGLTSLPHRCNSFAVEAVLSELHNAPGPLWIHTVHQGRSLTA